MSGWQIRFDLDLRQPAFRLCTGFSICMITDTHKCEGLQLHDCCLMPSQHEAHKALYFDNETFRQSMDGALVDCNAWSDFCAKQLQLAAAWPILTLCLLV